MAKLRFLLICNDLMKGEMYQVELSCFMTPQVAEVMKYVYVAVVVPLSVSAVNIRSNLVPAMAQKVAGPRSTVENVPGQPMFTFGLDGHRRFYW